MHHHHQEHHQHHQCHRCTSPPDLFSLGNVVGYSIRLETRRSANTRLLFSTTGIMLRRLQSDPALAGVTHVVVDEVHERSLDSDFLLILLRRLLNKRKDLKVTGAA